MTSCERYVARPRLRRSRFRRSHSTVHTAFSVGARTRTRAHTCTRAHTYDVCETRAHTYIVCARACARALMRGGLEWDMRVSQLHEKPMYQGTYFRRGGPWGGHESLMGPHGWS